MLLASRPGTWRSTHLRTWILRQREKRVESQPVENATLSLPGVRNSRRRYLAEIHQFSQDISNKTSNGINGLDRGDPYGNRTRVTAVSGRNVSFLRFCITSEPSNHSIGLNRDQKK